MAKFQLKTKYKPAGDQKQAIDKITQHIRNNKKHTTLLGVTGSGKTFTMANVIANLNRPTLVLSHNKTLAAQLYEEYKDFFPNNAVKYFVSYYDYYQPEAYMPSKDVYIDKEADINKEIERFRLSAMNTVTRRRDVIVVASVSCIYNIGKPDNYENMAELIEINNDIKLSELMRTLATLQYSRGEYDYVPGTFRLKGDTMEIFPPYEEFSIRIELLGNKVERITTRDPLTNQTISEMNSIEIYQAKSYVVPPEVINPVVKQIKKDLALRLEDLNERKKLLEAQRLEQRTMYDTEMLENTGYCSGIENYSRYFDKRKPGEPPYTLLDYFPDDYLMIIDESHMTIPQVRGMSNGDHARKSTLVEHGFRLPSALDNRPLNFNEFLQRLNQVVYTSATPADWELEHSKNQIVEQILRPTGLLDPKIDVRPSENQIDDVIEEVQKNIENKQRVLITTLTKRMAEDLSSYLKEMGLKVQYLHSDIDTVERIDILRDLRLGTYDVVVGINLLREGIDLPEVSLVIILDADKQGFLRSTRSLVQNIGRAARHSNGRVIMYADKMTDGMSEAISETNRRRRIQAEYNKKHNITPTTIKKDIRAAWQDKTKEEKIDAKAFRRLAKSDIKRNIKMLEQKMSLAAQNLEFERAAELRDQVMVMKQLLD
ncbi:MAG: excinuclease ABC subunit UvrB [Patescibacteria group bacterium]|nr:excinuclease ABC subunit UvrB [Patescibacteria group bacterium]